MTTIPRIRGHFLHQLRNVRIARNLRREMLERITGLEASRIHELEKADHEPFLDEAVLLQRALGCASVMTLITSGDLTLYDLDLGVPLPTDLDMLRAGVRLPLSLACRVALRVGLDDPTQLIATGISREVWHIITSLRNATCPYCYADLVGDAAPEHESTCLPELLWGRRDHIVGELGARPHPIVPGKGRRASGRPQGLLHQLAIAGMEHQKVAAACGIRPDYFSKLVHCRLALTVEKAEAISNVLKCDVALLYAPPPEGSPHVPSTMLT